MARNTMTDEKTKVPDTLPDDIVIDVEAKPVTPEEAELPEDGGEEDLYDYVVMFKNGHVSNHADTRRPDQMLFDFRLAVLYPLTSKAAFTDEEWERFEKLEKEDPHRYKRKDARVYSFVIGQGDDEDGQGEALAHLDPREVQAIIPADGFGPPMPDVDDDVDDDDDDPPVGGEGGGGGGGRKSLRKALGKR